jgi:hypothetical protein
VRRASLLLLTVVSLTACSGGGSGGQRLTRDQYAAQADSICSKYKKKADTLKRPASLAGLAQFANRVALPLLRNARGELRKLRPPEDEQATANAWLDAFDVTIDDVQKIRDAANKDDRPAVVSAARLALRHDQHANEVAGRLGMTVCSKD